jgi:hypothetical protein
LVAAKDSLAIPLSSNTRLESRLAFNKV